MKWHSFQNDIAEETGSIFQKIENIDGIVSALKDGFYTVLIERRSTYVEAYPVTGDIGGFPCESVCCDIS